MADDGAVGQNHFDVIIVNQGSKVGNGCVHDVEEPQTRHVLQWLEVTDVSVFDGERLQVGQSLDRMQEIDFGIGDVERTQIGQTADG